MSAYSIEIKDSFSSSESPCPDSDTGDVTALLPKVMVKNFQKKYEKAGAITITDATADTSILEAKFLDGAQN